MPCHAKDTRNSCEGGNSAGLRKNDCANGNDARARAYKKLPGHGIAEPSASGASWSASHPQPSGCALNSRSMADPGTRDAQSKGLIKNARPRSYARRIERSQRSRTNAPGIRPREQNCTERTDRIPFQKHDVPGSH